MGGMGDSALAVNASDAMGEAADAVSGGIREAVLVDELSDACHDLLQFASAILALAALAKADPGGPDVGRRLDQIDEEARRFSDLCVDVLGRAERTEVALDEVLPSLVANTGVDHQGLLITDFLPATACASRAGVVRAVVNLLSNARRASGPTGVIRVATWTDGGDAVVEVADSGPGLDIATRSQRRGLGIVRTVMRRNDGSLVVAKGPLGGAAVQLRFKGVGR